MTGLKIFIINLPFRKKNIQHHLKETKITWIHKNAWFFNASNKIAVIKTSVGCVKNKEIVMHNYEEIDRMVTRVQKQIEWAPWLQNIPEMPLEPHLVEIKHQPESYIWHPEPLAHGKLCHKTLHWENLRAATTSATGSNTASETLYRPNRWAPCVTQNSPSHPWDKPAQPLGRMTPLKKKKKPKQQKVNCILAQQQKGQKCWKCTGERGESKELISAQLSVNKLWKGRKSTPGSKQTISHSPKQGR
jgi:hypothetical protein